MALNKVCYKLWGMIKFILKTIDLHWMMLNVLNKMLVGLYEHGYKFYKNLGLRTELNFVFSLYYCLISH